MPRIQPLFLFLRPVSAPRIPACRHFPSFSTATRLRVDASTIAPEPTPASPPSTPEAASRAADLAAAEAATDADSAQPSAPKPVLPSKRRHIRTPKIPKPLSASTPSGNTTATEPQSTATDANSATIGSADEALQKVVSVLPPPKYFVGRSANKNYPVYTDTKRGGNLHITSVRKITGDLAALGEELKMYLNKQDTEVKLNDLTKQVHVKGFHKPEIVNFLKARGM